MDTRRAFLQKLIAASVVLPFAGRELFAAAPVDASEDGIPDVTYRYAAMSVSHFPEMQKLQDEILGSGRASDHPTFRGYIEKMRFAVPEDFPTAESVVVVAALTRMRHVAFHKGGIAHEVVIPHQYSESGFTGDDVKRIVEKRIIREPGRRVERMKGVFLKSLAVRSGLAEYGRNNITYVEGMGSLVTLYAFLTDHRFERDGYRDVRAMDRCASCGLCGRMCPTGAIREDDFLIDVGKCVSLYNEVEGTFPEWMEPGAHNALMGCMRCQLQCPANAEAVKLSERLEDVTEDETRSILEGKPNEALLKSLSRKLRNYYPATSAESFPIFTRNLRVLLD